MNARSLLLMPLSSLSPITRQYKPPWLQDQRSKLDESFSERNPLQTGASASAHSFGIGVCITARLQQLLRVLLTLVSCLDAGGPRLMRSLTQLAAPARLALSSRQRHRNTPGTVLTSPTTAGAVPLYTDSAHVPPELNAAAEVQQERPHYREQTAGMATFASGRQRWVDLVARLLPGSTPDQQRIRNAMFAVDRACFVEPHTPEALVYEVQLLCSSCKM